MERANNSTSDANPKRDLDIKSASVGMINSTNDEEHELSISDLGQEIRSESNLSNAKQIDGSNFSDKMDKEKINLVGGHINQIIIESKEVILKKTSVNEVEQYQLIFDDSDEAKGLVQSTMYEKDEQQQQQIEIYKQNIELRTFIPKFIAIDIVQNEEQKLNYYLRLENMMKGRENASIIDLKMGTSTVTCNIISSPKRLEKRQKKDKNTTSQKLGLKVIGYVIKSAQQTIEEKFYKWPYKKAHEIPVILSRIFSWPKSDHDQCICNPNFDGIPCKLNIEAQQQILGELFRLHDFLVHRSQRDIKGASILILVDHFSRSYAVKIIDLSTIVIKDKTYRDEGLIKGVTTLIQFIQKLE